MKIIIDYNEEKNNVSYYNNVMAAIEVTNEKFFIDRVEFVNFEFGEIASILALIKNATNSGKVFFTRETIVYKKTKEKLIIVFPDNP